MTKAEADRVVEDLRKKIGEPIIWKRQKSRHQRFRFEARVIVPEMESSLRLTGYASSQGWGYVLLGPANEQLRKISSPHTGHRHPDGSEAHPKHKHYWDGDYKDWWTYEPDDIRWDDCNTALVDFIAECNIELLHDAPSLAFQTELEESEGQDENL